MKLLDSNIVIALVSSDDDALNRVVLGSPYNFSVITRIEVLGYHLLTPDDRADLLTFLSGGRELGLDDAVVAKAVELRQSRRMGLGDAIIAASALVHKLPLVTRNVADFRHIGRLEIIDPFSVS